MRYTDTTTSAFPEGNNSDCDTVKQNLLGLCEETEQSESTRINQLFKALYSSCLKLMGGKEKRYLKTGKNREKRKNSE